MKTYTQVSTEQLLNKLSKKYPSPQYAFLSQVRNHTGWINREHGTRTADAMALSLWPSRGLHLEGFELKISRSDWQHELKQPQKAEGIVEFCDYFTLVISDISIIDIGEVPKTWGIKALQHGTIKTIRESPMLQAKPMDRAFLCGFMRNVAESTASMYTPTAEVDSIVKERVAATIEYEIKKSNMKSEQYDKLIDNLRKFKESSGLDLEQMQYAWRADPEKLGEAVKMVMDGEHRRLKERLIYLQQTASNILLDIDKQIQKMDEKT